MHIENINIMSLVPHQELVQILQILWPDFGSLGLAVLCLLMLVVDNLVLLLDIVEFGGKYFHILAAVTLWSASVYFNSQASQFL
jgi:hypothetical protein